MNEVKVGQFIADCRKQKNMTQVELAKRLNITNRAISKWETGKNLPDASIMLELCEILGISANDLLSGERADKRSNSKLHKKISINKKIFFRRVALLTIFFVVCFFAYNKIIGSLIEFQTMLLVFILGAILILLGQQIRFSLNIKKFILYNSFLISSIPVFVFNMIHFDKLGAQGVKISLLSFAYGIILTLIWNILFFRIENTKKNQNF